MVHQLFHQFAHNGAVQHFLEGLALLFQGFRTGSTGPLDGGRQHRSRAAFFLLPGASRVPTVFLSIPAAGSFLDLIPDYLIHRSQRGLFQSLGRLEHGIGHPRRLFLLFGLGAFLEDLPVISL